MPKGTTIIKSRDVWARIGRFLAFEELEELTKGMARAEAYRLIAALLRHEVENLRDRTRYAFDAKGLRKQWKAERRAPVVEDLAHVPLVSYAEHHLCRVALTSVP